MNANTKKEKIAEKKVEDLSIAELVTLLEAKVKSENITILAPHFDMMELHNGTVQDLIISMLLLGKLSTPIMRTVTSDTDSGVDTFVRFLDDKSLYINIVDREYNVNDYDLFDDDDDEETTDESCCDSEV